MSRVEQELDLLRTAFPDLDYRLVDGVHWVRIPSYSVPPGWSHQQVEVVFQIPGEPGQQPYAFRTRPGLALADGATPTSYSAPVATPWGDDFGQFSWAPDGQWIPRADIRAGANMLNFVQSFSDRLGDVS